MPKAVFGVSVPEGGLLDDEGEKLCPVRLWLLSAVKLFNA